MDRAVAMKKYADLVSRLRMAALATHAFPTERGRRLREEHEHLLNDAAEALESVDTPGGARPSTAEDERIVAELDTEYQAAVERNDAETMDRILADDFVLITGLGRTYSKSDLLKEARSKSTIHEYQKDTDQKVRVWRDTAVITALLRAKGTTDGKPFEYTLWFSDTYVRTPSGWRDVLGQASSRIPSG
jgi:ketosteroid isomerase-like protein